MSSSSKKPSKTTAVSGAEECMCALMTTVKMVHRYVASKFSDHPHFDKLSGPRVGVLFIVHHAEAIRMGDLASKLMVSPRTVTDLVDGLERDGFLRRIPDPKDRRAMLIELTPAIKTNFNKLAAVRTQFLGEIWSVLTAAEQEEMVRLLNKVQSGPLSKFSSDIECGPF